VDSTRPPLTRGSGSWLVLPGPLPLAVPFSAFLSLDLPLRIGSVGIPSTGKLVPAIPPAQRPKEVLPSRRVWYRPRHRRAANIPDDGPAQHRRSPGGISSSGPALSERSGARIDARCRDDRAAPGPLFHCDIWSRESIVPAPTQPADLSQNQGRGLPISSPIRAHPPSGAPQIGPRSRQSCCSAPKWSKWAICEAKLLHVCDLQLKLLFPFQGYSLPFHPGTTAPQPKICPNPQKHTVSPAAKGRGAMSEEQRLIHPRSRRSSAVIVTSFIPLNEASCALV
jgi:hypothetical protein